MKTSFDTYFESQMKDSEFKTAYQIAFDQIKSEQRDSKDLYLNRVKFLQILSCKIL